MLKFSIVIPIYNTEEYLAECIDSVINQSYPNIEIILINDGSPKNADEICNEYLKKDSKIKYFSKSNEGVAIARNYGISKATGDYVYCVDSDDTIENDFVAKVVQTANETQAEFIIIGGSFCQKTIELIGALPTCAFAVKKEILDKYHDVRFIEGIQPCEDGLFSHKLLALTDKIAKCPDAIYNYRYNPNSSEHTLNSQKILNDILKWYDVLEDFYNKYNLWNKKVHLLAFINNEPFGLRFCNMLFKNKEKREIFNITHDFINQHHLSEVNKYEIKKFSEKFYNFVISQTYYEYQIRENLRKIFILFFNFIYKKYIIKIIR